MMSDPPNVEPSVLVARDGAVGTITVNRPAVRNALNDATLGSIDAAVAELDADPEVRAIIVTGAGEKAFIAGADINELSRATAVTGRMLAQRGQAVFDRIAAAGKPIIAVINGFCLGGGCELALACTFRFAADTAEIGQPEINLGIIPGYGGSQRLPRLIGRDKALDLILTGRRVAAPEALALGLVTRVYPAATLRAESMAFARELAAKAPIAVRLALDAVRAGLEQPLAEALAHEAALFGLVAATDDMREGTRAFLEKRPATFTGR
ncbi:MAG: enoyl-CoA hydratase-related protein [Vicinamibacteraceae bacterium]